MKLKGKVDRDGNIAVLWINDGHGEIPGLPEIVDDAMRRGFEGYTTGGSATLWECRRSCFCVLAHGNPRALSALNDQESIGLVTNYYLKYGRGRKLLLLSCLTGLQLARRLASTIGAEVIAPTGLATIEIDGTVHCVTGWWGPMPPGEELAGTRNWIRVQPGGGLSLAGTSILEPSFVNASYLPSVDIKR